MASGPLDPPHPPRSDFPFPATTSGVGRPWPSDEYVSPRPPATERKPKIWLHVLLFVATVVSTAVAVSPAYGACLMLILTCHEFGHYFAAQRHRVKVSLPYFIPSPLLLGTFGAVIRMSPYIPNRRALFDIAAAGPIAGVVVALPVSFIGMMLSSVKPAEQISGANMITLGDPLIFQLMEWMVFGPRAENFDIVLHPVAFAGWVGMFVTALNLLPISQLDGGHIVHAVFGKASKYIAGVAFIALAGVTLSGGYSYGLFLVLLWFMGVKHPPTLNDAIPLDRQRAVLAVVLLVVFILCFTPSPLEM